LAIEKNSDGASVIPRSEATKDPYAAEESSPKRQGSFAALRMTAI